MSRSDRRRPSRLPMRGWRTTVARTLRGAARTGRRRRARPAGREGPHPVGPEAEAEAAVRLGWVDTLAAVPRAAAAAGGAARRSCGRRLDHVVLAGMGGSSLAPEVICRTAGAPLTVLDTTDPGQVRAALADRLDRTRRRGRRSKSGGTVETDSHRRAYWQAFAAAGVADVGRRFVVVTDPGSPLEKTARDAGVREVFLADPDVGGRYSALTAFGLVPARAGRRRRRPSCSTRPRRCAEQPGARRRRQPGAGAGRGARRRRRRPAGTRSSLADDGSGIAGFGDWAEQLIAESTGKNGRGHPAGRGRDARTRPGATGRRRAPVDARLRPARRQPARSAHASVNGPLGAQFLVWEYATAVAGRVLGINPFDQPNVTESPRTTPTRSSEAGDGPLPEGDPAFTDGAIEVYGDGGLLGDADRAPTRWPRCWRADPGPGLPRRHGLPRPARRRRGRRAPRRCSPPGSPQPVTFGWGPRFLHSTGQYHKGGPQVGAFLQITGAVTDRPRRCPGQPYTFGQLQAAQALGDLQALARRGRPLLRLHLHRPRRRARPQLAARAPLASATDPDDRRRSADAQQPAARSAGPPAAPDPGAVRPGGLRRHRRPVPQEAASRPSTTWPTAGCCRPASCCSASPAATGATASSRSWPARRPRRTRARRGGTRSGRGWPAASSSCPARSTTTTRSTSSPQTLDELRDTHGIQGNAAFYLSIPPAAFPVVLKQMQRTGMADNEQVRRLAPGRRREAVRPRPGVARCELNDARRRRVHRRRTCSASTTTWARRRSRTSWRCGSPTRCSSRSGTRHYVDSVQITMAEDVGIGTPGRLLRHAPARPATCCRTTCCSCWRWSAMEEPTSFDADAIRTEKLKVLRAISLPDDIATSTRSAASTCRAGSPASGCVGYLEEENVAGRLHDRDVRRGHGSASRPGAGPGVPFYLRTGKRLPRRVTEIAVHVQEGAAPAVRRRPTSSCSATTSSSSGCSRTRASR